MYDFEKMQTTLKLLDELTKGRKSGEENGWLTLETVEKTWELPMNKEGL